MKKILIPFLIFTYILSLSACDFGPSKNDLQNQIEELQRENEYLTLKCNELTAEKDFAVASAYFLNTLLENRYDEDYLQGRSSEWGYYYIDFINEFAHDYAINASFYKLSDEYEYPYGGFETFNDMIRYIENSEQLPYDVTYLQEHIK